MSDSISCWRAVDGYCQHCDVLVGLPGLHVIGVERTETGLRIEVESGLPEAVGCRGCGALARGHGRQPTVLIDAPCFAAPVRLLWRKRRWLCLEPACEVVSFVEQDPLIAQPKVLLTRRAIRWAVDQMQRENASVHGVARQLGVAWKTVWRAITPVLEAAARDESRFNGVTTLGVDEHLWHHVSTKPVTAGGRGPHEFTGMVDLTPDQHGRVHARLLDLVPGRSGQAYARWLAQRGQKSLSSCLCKWGFGF